MILNYCLPKSLAKLVITGEERTGMQPALLIAPTSIVDVCMEMRNNPKTYFDFLLP
jgi:NADH-quinone oxidoreductase subunit C